MNQDTKTEELEQTKAQAPEKPQEDSSTDGEFKVTVRKLEVPVRPRGVLAE